LKSDNLTCDPYPCILSNWTDWSPCRDCSGANINRTRTIDLDQSEGSPLCSQYNIIEFRTCSFPCSSSTTDGNAGAIFLEREWSRTNWIMLLFDRYNLDELFVLDIATKDNSITIDIIHYNLSVPLNCSSLDIENAKEIILQNSQEVLTNITDNRFSIKCEPHNYYVQLLLTIAPLENTDNNTTSYLVATIIFVVVIIGIICAIFALRIYPKISNIRKLPLGVRWSFESAALDFFGISWKKYKRRNFKMKQLPPGPDYDTVKKLFDKSLSGEGIPIKSITAVYNPILVDNFVGDYLKWNARLSDNQAVFQKNTWKGSNEIRLWIMEEFKARVDSFDWNKGSIFPIIAACHGTVLENAVKICNGGFAALSLVDAGYYGKGIYVTSYAIYSLQYAMGNHPVDINPVIIISYVLPGHPYPVVEDFNGEDSISGSALKPGCQSHYVRTYPNGCVVRTPNPSISYDEIVINQENLVVPAFIIRLESKDCMQILKGKESENAKFEKHEVEDRVMEEDIVNNQIQKKNKSDDEDNTETSDEQTYHLIRIQ